MNAAGDLKSLAKKIGSDLELPPGFDQHILNENCFIVGGFSLALRCFVYFFLRVQDILMFPQVTHSWRLRSTIQKNVGKMIKRTGIDSRKAKLTHL